MIEKSGSYGIITLYNRGVCVGVMFMNFFKKILVGICVFLSSGIVAGAMSFSPARVCWQNNLSKVNLAGVDQEKQQKIKVCFMEVLNYIHNCRWRGACHPTSAVLFVLFNELGLSAQWFTGVVSSAEMLGGDAFDHSWVEAGGLVYDASISLSLSSGRAPIFGSIDLKTGKLAHVSYGVDLPLDQDTERSMKSSVSRYITLCSKISGYDIWDLIKSIGSKAGMALDTKHLKEKYDKNYRAVKVVKEENISEENYEF